MTKTITITDPMQVKVRDKAYFKGCDFGFDVIDVDTDDEDSTIAVYNPLSDSSYWASSSLFDHATREVEVPGWPDPRDFKLHVYLGADGKRYIYNPTKKKNDFLPWLEEGSFSFYSRNAMESYCHDALPLTELELIPKESES